MWKAKYVYPIVCILCLTFSYGYNKEETTDGTTDLAKEPDDRLLLFSTIDGSLIAIEQQTGKIKWKTKDHPTVKVPICTKEAIVPIFLPDPRDGSLYLLGGENNQILKKLPFTIPQLVASSPCRSSDGILYTGKKKDTWFMIDPETGSRQKVLGFDKSGPTCPITSPKAVYLGRTEYTIMMIDSKDRERKWNVTFYDYTASPMTKEMLHDYDLVHFTASSTGRVTTFDRRIGRLLWETDLGSPVVAIYILDPEGLLATPFSTLAQDTLAQLAQHFHKNEQPFSSHPSNMQLYPTLYIGEHVHGLYALPSLVDQNAVTISASNTGPLLLEGPNAAVHPSRHRILPLPGTNVRIDPDNDPVIFQSIRDRISSVVLLGYYNVPDYSRTRLQISGRVNNMPATDKIFFTEVDDQENASDDDTMNNKNFDDKVLHLSVAVQTDPNEFSDAQNKTNSSKRFVRMFYNVQNWLNDQESALLKLASTILMGSMIAMVWYVRTQMREFQQLSQNGSRGSQPSTHSLNGSVTAIAEDLPDGIVRVGKITFNPEQLLGKGCDGTFVYRGQFDNRDVAVKRLLPECFTFADREVDLLRESDQHAHVIRYFCMEQDRQFRYIALELCAATVQDYVMGRYDVSLIKPLTILYQATSGLSHLHSLDIVHRDIKPQNVLLSVPNVRGEVRAMISDFGLCKKLQLGRMSFSRRSGITGTDGWIAPEMLNGERTTCAVDLFSLGCLFYYVLSEGKHPFGEPLRRQANILSGEFRLNDIKGEEFQIELAQLLVTKLISVKVEQRPPATAVLLYPLFWEKSTILAFYQDISDRIEKAELDDAVLLTLERHGQSVVRGDWRLHIDPEVAQDLRKYRSYRGESVRDLMRALRNKKHHYRELSAEAQHSLGDIPDKFTSYWNSRFPLLLIHSWLAMQCVKQEPSFRQYYHPTFAFNEKSHRDTCYPQQMEDIFTEYTETNYENYYLSDVNNVDKINKDMWIKKQKPKPYEYRKSSPRKYNNRVPKYNTFQSPPNQTMNDDALKGKTDGRKSSPIERRFISDTQGARSDFQVVQNRSKYKGTKNKEIEEPLLWSLPPDNK